MKTKAFFMTMLFIIVSGIGVKAQTEIDGLKYMLRSDHTAMVANGNQWGRVGINNSSPSSNLAVGGSSSNNSNSIVRICPQKGSGWWNTVEC